MNYSKYLTLVCISLIFSLAAFAVKKPSNSFARPDFAYPQTVSANAQTALERSLASGNELDAVKAVLQLVVAQNDISTANMPKMALLIDRTASKVSAPAASILYMIEAQLYAQTYDADAGTYSGRNLPLDSFPADPQLWSKELFALKVRELVDKSLKNSSMLTSTGSGEWKSLFTGLDAVTLPFYPNLYSLLAPIGCAQLSDFTSGRSAIPFGKPSAQTSPSEQCEAMSERLTGENARLAQASGDAAWYAQALSPSLSGMDQIKAFYRLIEAYRASGSPYACEFLRQAYSFLPDKQEAACAELRGLMLEAVSKYPDYNRINVLKSLLEQFDRAYCNLAAPGQVLPGKPFRADVKKAGYAAPLYIAAVKYNGNGKNLTRRLKAGEGTIVGTYPVPSDSCRVEISLAAPDDYLLIPTTSKGNDRSGMLTDSYPVTLICSGMQAYYTSDTKGQDNTLYILDAANGQPLKGVKVTLTNSRKKQIFSGVTDGQGAVKLSGDNLRDCNFKAVKGADTFEGNLYSYRYNPGKPALAAQIFTSLAIYKPGKECEFALVTYRLGEGVREIAPGQEVRAVLYNASYQPVDTLNLTTDLNGRAAGRFTLPKEGMLGSFRICAENPADGINIGSTWFQVEDYRQPGFFVEAAADKRYYSLGEPVVISGRVSSYSGMPVAGAEVQIDINYTRPWWRYYGLSEGSYAEKVTTDASGAFKLTLQTSGLKDTPFAQGNFTLTASATSQAGETQKSQTASFSLGNLARANLNIPSKIEADAPEVSFKASVEGCPDTPQLDYTLKNADGQTVSQGIFPLPELKIPVSKLPSGRYSMRIALRGDSLATDSCEFILWRASDRKPPVSTALWTPETEIEAKDSGVVRVTIGSSRLDQNILAIISSPEGILSRKQLTISDANTTVEVPVPAANSQNLLTLFTVSDGTVSTRAVTITPPARKLEMEVVSFRDKISAGDRERWTFRYNGLNTTASEIPVIATLSDKALNALVPFAWSWSPYLWYRNSLQTSTFEQSGRSSYYNLRKGHSYSFPDINTPLLFTYDRQLFPGAKLFYYTTDKALSAAPEAATGSLNGIKIRGSHKMAMPEMKEEVAEDAMDAGMGASEPQSDKASEQLRPAEMPLAWFKPALVTDKQGNLEISFETPNYNTTWQLQLMAYNRDMLTARSELSAVASKPVMVQASAPRFLRTGDRAILPVTIFNNTAGKADITAVLTLFDPLTGREIETRNIPAQAVDSMGSAVVALEFTVPSDIQFVGYRAQATAGSYSDGEQSLISILPSSSPVIESYPFYLAPAQQQFSFEIPKLTAGSSVTLQYCDNPVWYTVTALPDLSFSQNASILSKANALYANAIAEGLVTRYPQLGRAIELWKQTGDSTLISALERNPELKAVALSATPWVSNAQSETLRMQQLSRLLDHTSANAAIADACRELISRQNDEGGWSWCEGMPASTFITSQILWRLAMLHQMDFVPDISGLPQAERKAVSFMESEILKDYNRDPKHFSYESLLNWLYIRSFFKEIPANPKMQGIKQKALKAIRNGWKSYDIYETATAATLLFREGYPTASREILESLRQRASSKPERGMWFDNLSRSFSAHNNLVTTAQALEAFTEITPDSPCIDPLRQYLLIERQAQDWGTDAQLAEVVCAILSSGSDWTAESAPAQISLDGKQLTVSKLDALTGSFTLPLTAAEASGKTLQITRSAQSPAWGGIEARYIAPIQQVKDFSESDVTITKRLLQVVTDETGTHTLPLDIQDIKPGMKVRVQLTVTSGRAIDYAVITDEQAGCLAPVNQISGYDWQGEVGYYREVRQGQTNFFISRLPKGEFYVEYDCWAEGDGSYALGIATLQSLYYPMLSAHSAGALLRVSK